MRVDQLMTKKVKWCTPDDTLDSTAQFMWNSDCGCLPVCAADGMNRVIGVITDRDICMSALFQGKALHELRVADAMARVLKACRPSDSLADAEKIMSEARIRRLPVVDDQGSLVGIIALADLAREAVREHAAGKSDITESAVGDTLAAICGCVASQQLAA
jgi:CBS-domain-containing membrane protein